MKVGLAQINTTVGDFAGNVARLREAYDEAAAAGAEIVVAPELTITGYPPRDLLLKMVSLRATWRHWMNWRAMWGSRLWWWGM